MTNPRGALRVVGTVLVALAAVLVWWFQAGNGGTDGDRGASTDPESGLAWVEVEELPDEAEETLELIDAGGPFPHERDGVVFGNYEGVLPEEPRGHYREYTVPTPGLAHRGARRIVAGGDDAYYWTEDHYESFERIAR